MEIVSRKDALAQGLTHYFTGKPCKKGHIAPRAVVNWTCLECVRLRVAEYRKRPGYQKKRRAYDRANARRIAELSKVRVARFHERNPGYKYERVKKRRSTVHGRILETMRSRLQAVLKGKTRAGTARKLVGCTWEHLIKHLESQFKPGMTWDNYGEWEVDHIIPCAAFNLESEAAQRVCFHYTNLQPLWMAENRSKGARVLGAA